MDEQDESLAERRKRENGDELAGVHQHRQSGRAKRKEDNAGQHRVGSVRNVCQCNWKKRASPPPETYFLMPVFDLMRTYMTEVMSVQPAVRKIGHTCSTQQDVRAHESCECWYLRQPRRRGPWPTEELDSLYFKY